MVTSLYFGGHLQSVESFIQWLLHPRRESVIQLVAFIVTILSCLGGWLRLKKPQPVEVRAADALRQINERVEDLGVTRTEAKEELGERVILKSSQGPDETLRTRVVRPGMG